MEKIIEREKELIKNTIDSLLEEWNMLYDSLSPRNLEYLEKISDTVTDLKCKLNDMLESDISPIKDVENDEGIHDTMHDVIDEYEGYMNYKKDYINTGKVEYLTMYEQEFGHMLDNIKIALEEIDEITKQDEEQNKERDMLKSFAKWAYQMFS